MRSGPPQSKKKIVNLHGKKLTLLRVLRPRWLNLPNCIKFTILIEIDLYSFIDDLLIKCEV